MQMLLSSRQRHGIRGERMCVGERKREMAKGGDLEMLLIHSAFSVFPLALTHIAVKEHARQAAEIDFLRRMMVRQQAFLCLLMFLISFSLHLSFLACASVVLEDGKQCLTFSFHSPFSLPVSLIPMLLFLRSQVARRVRAGFVGAHARPARHRD